MSIPELDFPALYHSANNGSIKAQRTFYGLILGEYFFLFCMSVSSVFHRVGNFNLVFLLLVFLFLALLLSIFKMCFKPDQNWYRCRALAESVKSLVWRFTMRSHPFGDEEANTKPKEEFTIRLSELIKMNRDQAANLTVDRINQVTESMDAIRNLSPEERLSCYVKNRIDDQWKWYSGKSLTHNCWFKFWILFIVAIYCCAILSLFASNWGITWAILIFDPLIVLVTSAIGWLQMKRHSELIASYNFSAQEIAIIQTKSKFVNSENSLSKFVEEAELAFSREHTQWVTR